MLTSSMLYYMIRDAGKFLPPLRKCTPREEERAEMSRTPCGNLSLHPVYFIYSYTNAMHFIFRLRMLLKLLVYSSNQIILTARRIYHLYIPYHFQQVKGTECWEEEEEGEEEDKEKSHVSASTSIHACSRPTLLYMHAIQARRQRGGGTPPS